MKEKKSENMGKLWATRIKVLIISGVLASIAKILVLVGIMYIVDTVFDKDFMFLRDPYGNPLLKLIWDKTKGGFAYTVGLICFSIFVVHVFYLLFKVIALLFIRPI